ncbi:MAG: single-stranded DNA-binding protein [Bacteriovoracaceae bacterium]|nr:single-stranded DNA-binding protein [Bacteriovoracaceae bacterium]
MSINKVILIGRLGQDPELKFTPSGQAVCKFSVATSEFWKDKNSGQKQEKTEWHRVVVWGKTAEHCNQYLAKGRQVFLEGKLQTSSWDGPDGQKRYKTEIVAANVQFLGGQTTDNFQGQQNSAARPEPQSAPGQQYNNVSNDTNFTADDIPF